MQLFFGSLCWIIFVDLSQSYVSEIWSIYGALDVNFYQHVFLTSDIIWWVLYSVRRSGWTQIVPKRLIFYYFAESTVVIMFLSFGLFEGLLVPSISMCFWHLTSFDVCNASLGDQVGLKLHHEVISFRSIFWIIFCHHVVVTSPWVLLNWWCSISQIVFLLPRNFIGPLLHVFLLE